ncbi:MAG: hypothetical protein KDD62_05505 [Bdellovibrionales bacterium]|nr:hypothetical protein [Bdellovibrionales bacterium]
MKKIVPTKLAFAQSLLKWMLFSHLLLGCSTLIAEAKVISINTAQQISVVDLASSNSPDNYGNSSGLIPSGSLQIITNSQLNSTKLMFRTSDGNVAISSLQDPLPAPEIEYSPSNGITAAAVVGDYLIVVRNPTDSIFRVNTTTMESTEIYSASAVNDLVPCDDNEVCFIHSNNKVAKVNVETLVVTLRPAALGGSLSIAYSQARDEILLADRLNDVVTKLPKETFVNAIASTVLSAANGANAPTRITVLENDSTEQTSLALLLDNGAKLGYYTIDSEGVPPAAPTRLIDAPNGTSFEDLDGFLGDSGGSSGSTPACADSQDNDGDGAVDLADIGCVNASDDNETDTCDQGSNNPDTDGDGTVDCADGCPNDPNKQDSDICGCGQADTTEAIADTDLDGVVNCNDPCPNENRLVTNVCGNCSQGIDPKTGSCTNFECDGSPGFKVPGCENCGEVINSNGQCSTTHGDDDACPNDAFKTDPGECGCGVPDTDSDRDGIVDCLDPCPRNGFLTEKDFSCECLNPNHSELEGLATLITCSETPDLQDDLELVPAPLVTILKVGNKQVHLQITLNDFRIPNSKDSQTARLRKKSKKRKKKPYIEYAVQVTQFEPSKQKSSKIKRTTKKNNLKVSVKKGSLVYISYEAKIKQDGNKKSKTVATTQASRPTVLVAR